jgi:EAL and modified HD-GYP domain-containing signal transduction protein
VRARDQDGYTLALDDYDSRPSLDPLLPLVKLIKLDVLGKTREQIEPAVVRLRARGLTVLAERVETVEMLKLCEALGCALFQGYVFSRPEVLDGRVLSVEQASMLNIAALLGDTAVSDDTIADAFRSNPALSLALLRIVNAAAYGGRGVESIPHAIRLIGRAALSRWLLVMLVTSMGKESPIATELVVETLVRARFCEVLALRLSPAQAASHFLMGLLSRLDMLLGEPMDQVLQRLPVSPEVRDALLLRQGRHALHLSLAEHYEGGVWAKVDATLDAIGGTRAELGALYAESVAWAVERTTG